MKQIKTLTVNGVTYEIADPDAASINDTKVGADAWSAKNIIDRLCPAFTETAPAVTCQPVAGYPLSVVSQITPTESGVDSLRLWHGGRNLIDIAGIIGDGFTKTTYGVTATVKDGWLTLSGTHTYPGWSNPLDFTNHQVKSVRLPAGTYSLPEGLSIQLRKLDNSAPGGNGNKNGTFTLTEECYLQGIYVGVFGEGTQVDRRIPLIIVAGAQAPVDYEPYRGKTLTASLGKTVHGGSYDWATGILTDENGETTQYTPAQIAALPGVNTLMGYQGDVTVSGRQDLPALLETLTSAHQSA